MRYNLNNLEGSASDILNSADVAQILGVSRNTLKKRAAVGDAPTARGKAGTRNVYVRADVWAFMEARNAGKAKTGDCRAVQCKGTGTLGRRGLCPRHWRAFEVLGDLALRLVLPKLRHGASLEDKLTANTITDPRTGCLVWIGGRSSDGYGRVLDGDRTVAAYAAAYRVEHGVDMDPRLEPDHECSSRACVAIGPGHVVPVTRAENMRRMAERAIARKATAAQVVAPVIAFPTKPAAEDDTLAA